MNMHRIPPALVLLAAGSLLAGSAALAQNVARDIARDPPDVKIPDDLTLARNVKMKLLHAPRASALDIDVKADDGVVTLSGLVESEEERTRAETIAHTQDGVIDVKNHIIVREGAIGAEGELKPDPRGASWDPPRTSPVPATPGAPSLPNGVPTVPQPLPRLDPE